MRAEVVVAVTATVILGSLPLHTSVAGATMLRIAQADFHLRRTPEPAPRVVIEEPRPPRVTIETEGRAGGRDCRSIIASDRRDQAKATDPERACDPE